MLEFIFERFEMLSNGSNLHWKALNPFQMVRICNRMLQIPFEWIEFAFECFESHLKGSNSDSNASNPFRNVKICIGML